MHLILKSQNLMSPFDQICHMAVMNLKWLFPIKRPFNIQI